eukprot:ANDGO_04190.mRNA.1 hypothetical protein
MSSLEYCRSSIQRVSELLPVLRPLVLPKGFSITELDNLASAHIQLAVRSKHANGDVSCAKCGCVGLLDATSHHADSKIKYRILAEVDAQTLGTSAPAIRISGIEPICNTCFPLLDVTYILEHMHDENAPGMVAHLQAVNGKLGEKQQRAKLSDLLEIQETVNRIAGLWVLTSQIPSKSWALSRAGSHAVVAEINEETVQALVQECLASRKKTSKSLKEKTVSTDSRKKKSLQKGGLPENAAPPRPSKKPRQ